MKQNPKLRINLFAALLILLLAGNGSQAQEALFGGPQIVSPEIKSDNTVMLRLKAPSADSVFVTGDILPPAKMKTPMGEMDIPGRALMSKGEDGIWTFNFYLP